MWEASDDRMKNYVKQQKICQTLSKIYPRMKWGRKRELLPDSEIEVKRKKTQRADFFIIIARRRRVWYCRVG